jgi:hypothetical protein
MGLVAFAVVLSNCLLSCSTDSHSVPMNGMDAPERPPLGPPTKLTSLSTDGDGVTLHLYVSNQSFHLSLVDIDIWLDDTHMVTGGFDVEGQHNWILFDLQMPAGSHSMRAEALDGTVLLNVAVPVPQERWGVLDFWYYTDDPSHPQFTWNLSATPVAFN